MVEKHSFNWLTPLKVGLIGGAVAVLISLVGMVQAFHERDIIAGVISMGQTLLLLVVLVSSYFAASHSAGRRPLLGVVSGAVAGLVAGGVVAVLVWLVQVVNLRQVLVNASPALFSILTFEKDVGTGIAYLLAAGTITGLVAGLIYLLPIRLRRAAIIALLWVGTIGLLQELLRVTLATWPRVTEAISWMFGSQGQKGLSVSGAVAIFLVVAVINYKGARWGAAVRTRVGELPPGGQRVVRVGSLVLVLAFLLILPQLLGLFLSEVANIVGIFILMGLGLNIVVGFAGLLDLGYVAFFAIGAYVMGALTTTGGELAGSYGLTFWQALPIAVGASILAGILLGIPVLHIRGDYLAIVTLGFGEIIRILALSDFLKPYIGGSQGIVLVARAQIGDIVFGRPQTLYYLILVSCLLGAFVAVRLKDSRLGRTWMALREDEDVAQAMGIDLVKTKLLAFAAGAAFSGLAGAIFASKLATIYPHSFNLLISINALALIIVGGMGSVPGVIIGALALVGLPELLREFAEFRLLVYGAVLVAMMLLRPEGLWPEEARRRELHEQEEPTIAEEAEAIKEAAIAAD